jgi:hypothetical protein
MPAIFINPANGYKEKAGSFLTPVWCLLFGPIYLAAAGLWGHAALYFAILLISASLMGSGVLAIGFLGNFIYAACALDILEKSYLRKGWKIEEKPLQKNGESYGIIDFLLDEWSKKIDH